MHLQQLTPDGRQLHTKEIRLAQISVAIVAGRVDFSFLVANGVMMIDSHLFL